MILYTMLPSPRRH